MAISGGARTGFGGRRSALVPTSDDGSRLIDLHRYGQVRHRTEALAANLSAEDQMVQTMPDVSPTKWHRAHTTWFFETFLLEGSGVGYEPFDPAYGYLFNSYYDTVGPRHPRAQRGLLSRPGSAEIAAYRRHVDEAMDDLLASGLTGEPDPRLVELLEIGLNHEEQHQELLLMDIKHVLFSNPLQPAYHDAPAGTRSFPAVDPTRSFPAVDPAVVSRPTWSEHAGGLVEVGHDGLGFAFDNELPRHPVHLQPFALRNMPVTNAEWQGFIDDGGYRRPELWLSEGWATACTEGWVAPLYWSSAPDRRGDWEMFTLAGPGPVDPNEPVCHVSYYEADAFARWAGCRLPTEFEWETVAASSPEGGNFLEPGILRPMPIRSAASPLFGDVWQWTASPYSPYPRFRVAPGAVGEYNGKFMVNQQVLRGGSCVTPAGHVRSSYRNYFPPSARWAFSGLRLARD